MNGSFINRYHYSNRTSAARAIPELPSREAMIANRHFRFPQWLSGIVGITAMAVFPVLSHAQNNLGASIVANGNSNGVPACASCHGVNGEGNAAGGFPRLAGLGATYLESQLNHFADGTRKNVVMEHIAKQLAVDERKAVSAYFAGLPVAPAVALSDEKLKEQTGAWLATRGGWDDTLPACVQCHGPGGVGVGDAFPAIAGQSIDYIAAQLHAFKNGTRSGGPMNLMRAVAQKLSDADIAAVSRHFGAASAVASQTSPARREK
ncbi:c-type cytochrome [Noviherbaspirillum sp. UKPF54]|uniref:c-type cytochrome n=1 Tax=Noviherbaspirillum sp. UKPF54 TaxID=2601898 RepID=UPI001FED4831|nr:c-type cytochrome [Noviherbaspirillum sp. UKPF54]